MLYLSEKTGKSYKTVEELEAAEAELAKAEEEKTKLKLNNDPDYKRYLRLMKDTKHKY